MHYEVRNILRGRELADRSVVRSYSGTTVGYPDTGIHELATALSIAGSLRAQLASIPVPELCRRIRALSYDYLADDRTLECIAVMTGSPISYVRASVNNLRRWMADIDRYANLVLSSAGFASTVTYQPLGVAGVILAGDEVALAGYIGVNAILSRCPTIMRPSTMEAISATEFVRALARHELADFIQLSFWPSSANDASHFLIECCDAAVVIGSDDTAAQLCVVRDAAGNSIRDYRVETRVVEFTTGHSAMIIMDSADVERAAHDVVHAASTNKGAECINAGKAYVHRDVLPALRDRVLELARGLRHGDPLDPLTAIGRIGADAVRSIRARSTVDQPNGLSETNILYADFGTDSMGLLVAEDDTNASDLVLSELPGPTLALVPFDGGIADAVRLANGAVQDTRSRRSTVTALHSSRDADIEHARAFLRTHKLLINDSTARSMDGLLHPHHGVYLARELVHAVPVLGGRP